MLECVTSLFTRHEPERMPRVNRGACAELDRAQALCELLDSPENAPDSNNHCAIVISPSQLLISNKIKRDLCSFPISNLARFQGLRVTGKLQVSERHRADRDAVLCMTIAARSKCSKV